MTDKEIIKSLECCVKAPRTCAECHLCVTSREPCNVTLASNALDLINRKQAEIANLEIELKAMRGAANSYKAAFERLTSIMYVDYARAEAIKEFAKRLKEKPIKYGIPLLGLSTKTEIEEYFNDIMMQVRDAIDTLVKEMTEEQK